MAARIDIISIAGIAVAALAILGGQALEGGHIGSLIQATAFLIVIGGTAGAIMLQHSLPVFLLGMRLARWIFQPPAADPEAVISQVVEWSNTARRGGLLALEPAIARQDDLFARKALQLLVDGAEPQMLKDTLELDIHVYEEHHRAAAKVWEAAGGYAPTVGILGAVMGLIHVMENLSDPSKLGGGIAVAFVAPSTAWARPTCCSCRWRTSSRRTSPRR
jgi:chemotaxis protein MotA